MLLVTAGRLSLAVGMAISAGCDRKFRSTSRWLMYPGIEFCGIEFSGIEFSGIEFSGIEFSGSVEWISEDLASFQHQQVGLRFLVGIVQQRRLVVRIVHLCSREHECKSA